MLLLFFPFFPAISCTSAREAPSTTDPKGLDVCQGGNGQYKKPRHRDSHNPPKRRPALREESRDLLIRKHVIRSTTTTTSMARRHFDANLPAAASRTRLVHSPAASLWVVGIPECIGAISFVAAAIEIPRRGFNPDSSDSAESRALRTGSRN